jgi:rubrerythrin
MMHRKPSSFFDHKRELGTNESFFSPLQNNPTNLNLKMHINSNTDATVFQYSINHNKNYKTIKDQINIEFKNKSTLD